MAGLDDCLDNYSQYWDLQDPRAYNAQDTLYRAGLQEDYSVPNDIPLNNTKVKNIDNDNTLRRFVYSGVGIASLITENLLCHPFVVLRRQCQVHNTSLKYHLIPITLVPVIYNLHKHQEFTSLWKGLGSTLIIGGLTLGIEDLISKCTSWPKLTYAVVLPLYAASLVETVQSDIASEKPGMLDVFREGAMRLINWGGNGKGRMIPIWVLILPTVTLGLSRYFFSVVVKSCVFRWRQLQNKQAYAMTGTLPKNFESIEALEETEMNASLISVIAADICFYPFETILHRLYLQGTRTIIDNLDTGKTVLPILTNYYGPVDCYKTCISSEGVFGLYKGFGGLLLQYAAHITVIRITRFALTEMSTFLYKAKKPEIAMSLSTINKPIPSPSYLIP